MCSVKVRAEVDMNVPILFLLALPETRPAYKRPSSTSTQKYNRPSTDNTIPPSSMGKEDLFKKIMSMMSAPTRSEDGRLMDEDGYYNEDGSRSWV